MIFTRRLLENSTVDDSDGECHPSPKRRKLDEKSKKVAVLEEPEKVEKPKTAEESKPDVATKRPPLMNLFTAAAGGKSPNPHHRALKTEAPVANSLSVQLEIPEGQPAPSQKARVVRNDALGKKGFRPLMTLKMTGKRSGQPYINARCMGLDGKSVDFAIRHFRYYDNKRLESNYTVGDLAYDIQAGRLADPR